MNDTLLNAVLLGTLAQSALVISGVLVYRFKFSDRVIGVLAGFGVGALIEAISFDLIAEAKDLSSLQFAVWMLLGAAVFLLGDAFVEKRFGGEGGGSAMGIVVGSIVDGVPESAIFGIQVATAFPISAGFLMAVFVSQLPAGAGSLGRIWPRAAGRWASSSGCGRSYWPRAAWRRGSATCSPVRSPA